MTVRQPFAPHAYQARAIQFVLDTPRAALWMEMGLGKTVVVLTAIEELLAGCEIERVLIVAPKRVAEHTWPAELAKWSHLAGLRHVLLTGARERREALLAQDPAPIHIIGRDLLPWLVERGAWPYDLIVVDEASGLKDHGSLRFRRLRSVAWRSRRLVELTGTPAANGLLDLWAPVYLMDRGQRLGRTRSAFQTRWFESDYRGWTWTPRPGAREDIEARLSDLVASMRADDYLELPPRTDITVPVELPAAALAQYRRLEREYLLALPERAGVVDAASAAVLAGKLLQLAGGAVYDVNGRAQSLHDAKTEALADLVEAANGAPLLVAYAYRHELDRLRAAFPEARTVEDQGVLAAWDRGEVPMLLVHPQAAGHGLNLQAGGSVVVWYGLTWSLEQYQQLNARLHRQGQQRPVRVYHLAAQGTIDERVLAVLRERATGQDALMRALGVETALRAAA